MYKKTYKYGSEGGNVVALTLLGLAAAILAGVVVLYVIGKSAPQPMYLPETKHEEVVQEEVINPREGWLTYENMEFNFHIEFPQGWVVATGTSSIGEPVISVFQGVGTTSPKFFETHESANYVSIYPQGSVSDDVRESAKSSNVIIQVPQASAQDYVLKTGKPWATKAVFDQYPPTWSKEGFVFARMVIEEEGHEYLREGVQIAEAEYDLEKGDVFGRTGFLDSSIRAIEEEILRSFNFIHSDGENATEGSLLQLTNPEERSVITSPLSVQGVVVGDQYFNKTLSIYIETDTGENLAKVPVTLNNEVASGTIPFDVSIIFGQTVATSGYLVFEGVEENGEKIRIPVLFSE